MEDNYNYSTNLFKKLDNLGNLQFKDVLCFWSDLLGFGNDFFQNQWILNHEMKKKVFERLRNAHKEFLINTIPFIENSLVLNDGLVKVCNLESKSVNHPDMIGLYLRGCINTHLRINAIELENNLPGCRSILTFGESIDYIIDNVTIDDYVLNYTKKKPTELSEIAKNSNNEIVVYNPSPFQINTAFSKSYILDSLGSKHGISGNNLFIDHSVIEFMKELAKKFNFHFEETNEADLYCVRILKEKDNPSFGFEIDKTIDISYKGWETKVYRIANFNPHEEKISEFKFEIKNIS
jgi:hypothetical protein